MNDHPIRPHVSFWLIAALILLWNAMGVLNYFMQMNPDALSDFSDSQRAVIDSRPAWATAGFAVAVFGGTLGGGLLLLRKSAAYHVLALSLLGTVVLMAYTISVFLNNGTGLSDILFMAVMPLIVAGGFVWYAQLVNNKGWAK